MAEREGPLKQVLAAHELTGYGGLGVFVEASEGVVEPGKFVAVSGIGRRERDPYSDEAGSGYRDHARWLVIEAGEDCALSVTNDPWALK